MYASPNARASFNWDNAMAAYGRALVGMPPSKFDRLGR